MAPLPAAPDTDRCWALRVPPNPYLRFDTCDYSLDPRLVGRKVEIRVTDREVTAVALDTGEVACRHPRSFAKHRTITALEHARTLKPQRDRGSLARPLRPVDRVSRPTTELAHLFRSKRVISRVRLIRTSEARRRGRSLLAGVAHRHGGLESFEEVGMGSLRACSAI
jgi:hypothetical protein